MLKVEWTVKINTGLQSLGDVVVDITLSSQMDILESSIKQISYQNTSPSMPEDTMTFQLPDLSEEFEMTFIGTGANLIIGDVYVDVKLTSPKDEFDSYSKRTNLDRTIHNKYSLTVGDIDYANETIQWHFDLDAVTTPVNSLSVSIKLEDNISNQLMNKIYTVATLHDGTVETYPYIDLYGNNNFEIHVVTSIPSTGDNKYTLIIENKIDMNKYRNIRVVFLLTLVNTESILKFEEQPTLDLSYYMEMNYYNSKRYADQQDIKISASVDENFLRNGSLKPVHFDDVERLITWEGIINPRKLKWDGE